MKKIKIIVVGLGYVGTSNAVLLALNHKVIATDINLKKIKPQFLIENIK